MLTKEEAAEWADLFEFHNGPAIVSLDDARWMRHFIFTFAYEREQMAQIIRQRHQVEVGS